MANRGGPVDGKADLWRSARQTCRVLTLALWAAATACADGALPAELNAVRDSAGVRIVESRSDERYPASWSLAQQPTWTVGELEGNANYLLDRVSGAMRLPDGTAVIANGGTNELRFYDRNGSFIKAEGREGQGPGEFESLRALGHCREDGFVAFDLNWQMNAYTTSGQFIEKTVLRAPEGVTPYNVACDPHGHILLMGWGRDATAAPTIGFHQAHDRLLLTDGDGRIEHDFGRRLVSERIGTQYGSRPHPAGRATLFGIHDDHVFIGSGERFDIEVRALDGSLLTVLRGPAIDLTMTDELKASYLAARLATASDDRHPDIRREIADWVWPDGFPAYVELKLDAAGVVWLLAYSPDPASSQVWSLLDPSVGYLGDLHLPPRHEVLEVGEDYVLVLTTDELGVQRVAELALERGGGVD